jgi:hypothetical protein
VPAAAVATQQQAQQQQEEEEQARAAAAARAASLGSPADARNREAAARALQDVLGYSEREAWAVLAREQGLVPLGKKQMQVQAGEGMGPGSGVGVAPQLPPACAP